MKTNFKYGSPKQANDDPQELVAYWLKLAPIIWPTKENKTKALNRFLFLEKTVIENKKANDAKITALKILIKNN